MCLIIQKSKLEEKQYEGCAVLMADESPGDEMKHTYSVKPLLGTLDMITSASSNSQSQQYGQAQSHWDEVPVGKYYEVI